MNGKKGHNIVNDNQLCLLVGSIFDGTGIRYEWKDAKSAEIGFSL